MICCVVLQARLLLNGLTTIPRLEHRSWPTTAFFCRHCQLADTTLTDDFVAVQLIELFNPRRLLKANICVRLGAHIGRNAPLLHASLLLGLSGWMEQKLVIFILLTVK